jgi:hypothetical protein
MSSEVIHHKPPYSLREIADMRRIDLHSDQATSMRLSLFNKNSLNMNIAVLKRVIPDKSFAFFQLCYENAVYAKFSPEVVSDLQEIVTISFDDTVFS